MAKGVPEFFLRSEGGVPKNFRDKYFLHQAPPLTSVCERALIAIVSCFYNDALNSLSYIFPNDLKWKITVWIWKWLCPILYKNIKLSNPVLGFKF